MRGEPNQRARHPKPRQHSEAWEGERDDDPPLEARGRSLGLRLLALLGAFAFLMLGLGSLAPLLQEPPPPPWPDQRRPPVG